ncbi:MAG: ATP-binding protein [Candidatus Marinimicrobia bacterium]|nr:ATP-binding protein [Candidatus Neomarinimicrobiota bacterium]
MTMKLVNRKIDLNEIIRLIGMFPVTAILGARQCGKTTIAKQLEYNHYFDLENPRDLARLEQPQLALEDLKGLIVIDEIQRKPDLFPLIRYLVDNKEDQKYLILGSASRNLLRQSSESLAGRIAYFHLGGFRIDDVGNKNIGKLWLCGSLPRSFLALSDGASMLWRENYIATFLERDIPQLGINIPAYTLRRFWIMLSHYHGQIINFSELARSFGISDMTASRYVEILESTFMIRVLPPWHINIGKRLVKRPKIYLRDSGIFHSLISISNREQLLSHNKLGASWEGFALECVCMSLENTIGNVYFWRTHGGTELDLFWQSSGKNWGAEFKFVDAPRMTKSIQIAIGDLNIEHLWIVYPGKDKYMLAKNVTVVPLQDFPAGWTQYSKNHTDEHL